MSTSRRPGSIGREPAAAGPAEATIGRLPWSRPGVAGFRYDLTGCDPMLPAHASPYKKPGGNAVERVVEALGGAAGRLVFEGRRLILVDSKDWPGLAERDRYEVVGQDEARRILAALASRPALNPSEREPLRAALDLLADTDGRDPGSGLLLLALPVARYRGAARDETPITPSQLARMMGRSEADDEHWVEIELLWVDGKPVAGERYRILTPDGQEVRGVTDARGRARVEGIVRDGQCQVSFPDLYEEDWRHA